MSSIYDSLRGAPQDNDSVLIERFIQGDESAFERLYAAYYDKVYSIARGILIDLDDTADAVQEIFTQVYKHLRRFDRRAKFSTWLFRIAVNRAIQHGRRTKYRYRQTELTEAAGHAQPLEEETHHPEIDAAMLQLNPNDRAILVLFYWEELSIAEIAASLNCGENAAKTRLYRARERFREIYEAER